MTGRATLPLQREVLLPDEAATHALGAALAEGLRPGLVIWLVGDLGAGKTTLVRGLLRALGHAGPVKSPTYSLVELYNLSSLYLYHFDFYRLKAAAEWIEAGFADAFDGSAVCLVEWPDRGGETLPRADVQVHLEAAGDGRRARLVTYTDAGAKCLSKLPAS